MDLGEAGGHAAAPTGRVGAPDAEAAPERAGTRSGRRWVLARQAGLLAAFLAVGVAETWPRASYLAGRLPADRDVGSYVWGFWWVAHQLTHTASPWVTHDLAAPVGASLGYHTLMPLPGAVLAPITLAFGPSASFNLLSVACPGLAGYAMYRAARLWLPSATGALAAGAFFGLSPILCWYSWYQLNLAIGAVFLPLALAAAVRLRRRPSPGRAIALGVTVGAAVLTDQESAVMVAILAALALLPWLVSLPGWAPVRAAGLAVLVSVAVAGPQLLAMAEQTLGGDAGPPVRLLARYYNPSGAGLVQMFAPSPRLSNFGLGSLTYLYYLGRHERVVIGYGVVLTVLAASGLVIAWRRRSARWLALLWAGSCVMALGSAPWLLDRSYRPLAVRVGGVPLSGLMPYTWFVQLPAMSGFREAYRFLPLGLVGAALLAGAAVAWLAVHARPVLALALACAVLELGWAGTPTTSHGQIAAMPTALPALDGPIAADHSRSIVVDVPFGIRGGVNMLGGSFPPQALVLATADGHPRADAFLARIPASTITGMAREPFYAGLLRAQGGPQHNTRPRLAAARANAARMDIGWVLVWSGNRAVLRYLRNTGFGFDYRADGASVYRPVSDLPAATARRGS